MRIPFLDLTRQHLSIDAELGEAIRRIIKRGQFILGEEVSRFEQRFGAYLGVKRCITCGNGTDALELALEVCGIGAGDEVIVPAYGWISPALAVKKAGAIPIFADVELKTGNINLNEVERLISEKTRAIIPIHMFGNPCRIEELRSLSIRHSLLLIEDCAQAHGAEVNGQKLGSFGDLSVFSFYPTKNLGCLGDGGAIVTDREDLAERLRALRDYGRLNRAEFKYTGRNSRLDEMQAAVLNVKLNYLDLWNERRQEIARRYWGALKSDPGQFPQHSVFYQFILRAKNRAHFRHVMSQRGIETDIYPVYIADQVRNLVPNTKELANEQVSVPVYQDLTESEISYICEQLNSHKDSIL